MKLNLLKATQILERTMPVMTRRFLIYGAVAFGLLFSIPLGAGAFYGIASFSDNPGFWGQVGATIAVAGAVYAYRLARRALYYHLDLVHLFAMVKRIEGSELPAGKEQYEFLKQQVDQLFSDPRNAYTHLQNLHRFIVNAFAAHPPGNGLSSLPAGAWVQKWVATLWLGFAASAMIAPAIKTRQLSAIRQGASVFCHHFHDMLRYSLFLNVFLYTAFAFAFWLFLKPVGWVDNALPLELGLWNYIFALILSFWIKVSFLDPIVTAAMVMRILPFCEVSQEQESELCKEILSELEPVDTRSTQNKE